MVETGKEQQKINYNLGKEIAKNTDYAIFVGVNATSLRLGAQSCGMLESKIGIVKTLNEATEILKKIEGGKAVLFANDLPDGY